MDDLVEKVETNRYDAALQDTLSALVAVYADHDPISVRQQDDHGALNIEVRSQQESQNARYDNMSNAKKTPIISAKHGKRSTFNGPNKSISSAKDDLAFVSPISAKRELNVNSSNADCPGDDTNELANLVENETN